MGKPTWLNLATSPSVVKRAVKTAAVVGPILSLINHGDAILAGTVSAAAWVKMGLTFLVPYAVATVSSVAALMRAGITHGDRC